MPKILLVNYSEQDSKRISETLGIETQRGYLAYAKGYTLNERGVSSPIIEFNIPESFAEFQAVYINFNLSKKLKEEILDKDMLDYKEKGMHYLKDYWFNNRGYLTVFTGKDLIDLPSLGIPIQAREALKTDKSVRLGIRSRDNNPLRKSLGEQLKNIVMPTTHYLAAEDDEVVRKYLNSGHLDRAYLNSSSKAIGVYIDSKQDEDDYGFEDKPQVLVLPTFKSLSNITVALTRTFSLLNPRLIPLSNIDWQFHDSYYPDSVAQYQKDAEATMEVAVQKIKTLEKAKAAEVKQLSSFMGILTQTGDDLVDSVQQLLSNVLGLNVVDIDAEGEAGNRKEDLLITTEAGEKILAEVKGTKTENPSPKYIGQATNHFIRKSDMGVVKCILIINHDYTTEPQLRKKAYTGDDAELLESVEYVSYLDTRVLHKICLSAANGNMTQKDAIGIIMGKGRIESNS